MDRLHQFYVSKAWRDLSYALKVASGGTCARCGFVASTREEWSLLIGHHKEELTGTTVNDPRVALNPALVEIICHDCHNKEHRRFGHGKAVYIVWGSPLSGKTSLVKELMRAGDLVLDIDALWSAVTLQPPHIKPNNVRFNVFALRDALLDQIKTRYGQWGDAYVVGGYPDKYDRERAAKTLGAELIYCESTMQECMERRRASGRPEAWDKYIAEWWAAYERTG